MNQLNNTRAVEKIRSQYVERTETELEQLRKLDRKVKRPAKIIAYILGVIGSLVLGTGMSYAMEVIGNSLPLGIVIGCIGILLVSANYYIYKAILKSRKSKYSSQIIATSDNLLNE